MENKPERPLLPVDPDDLEQAISHALRFDGRKSFKLSGEIMGKITASHLVHFLTQGGFVVMRKPPPLPPAGCAHGESAQRVMNAVEDATSRTSSWEE